MFIFTICSRGSPYLASSSSGKIASSKVFEHSSPMDRANLRGTLPPLRADITGGIDVWHPMPTRASFSAPVAKASLYARRLAEYVYLLPADASTSSRVRATPGTAFQELPSPSR